REERERGNQLVDHAAVLVPGAVRDGVLTHIGLLAVAPSTGWPPNAVEMRHTGVDRQLRVFGHDLQNRRWTQVRVPQHCRDPLEVHRAGAYLRVTKHIERRV